MDIEEGTQRTMNATSNKPKLISDGTIEPINASEPNPLWIASSSNYDDCCIYRVPSGIRRVNPDAYIPEMVLLGPIHHSKKVDADELSKTDLRYLNYKKMEKHKKKYLENIELRFGNQIVEDFKRIIKRDEQITRSFYAESTDWIKSEDFVKMMLLDSVFILVFFIQLDGPGRSIKKTGDFLFDMPLLRHTVFRDIILLENQLPYTLLENLFETFCVKFKAKTFRDIILGGFRFGEIKKETKFQHFTDLSWWVRVQTLGLTEIQMDYRRWRGYPRITNCYKATELDSAGVKFECSQEETANRSLVIKFQDGILTMPCFKAEDGTEKVLRNIMALEQCHYPHTAFVCNYITLLDYLIDTDQDVELFVKRGIIENRLGHPESVKDLVNNLCLGILNVGSQYYEIVESLNSHYKSHLNRSVATLKQVYFKDLWTGTATIAAVVLLVLTLIGTVASVLQVTHKDTSPTMSQPSHPPPVQKP